MQTSLPALGMVFGVFDGLHPGHQFFLRQAQTKCQTLVVVVTLEEIVEAIKGCTPLYSYTDRVAALAAFDSNIIIVPGDRELGSWAVLTQHQPDIICLGYDQHGLGKALESQSFSTVWIEAYKPDLYKSSLLRQATQG